MSSFKPKTIIVNRILIKIAFLVVFIFGGIGGIYCYRFIENVNDKHTTIYLTRYKQNNKTIKGVLRFHYKLNPFVYETIENSDFDIPNGTYELQNTYSNKFNIILPLVCNVPDRAGIRIHGGRSHEQSKGCILVSENTLEKIINFIYRNNGNNKITYIYINTVII